MGLCTLLLLPPSCPLTTPFQCTLHISRDWSNWIALATILQLHTLYRPFVGFLSFSIITVPINFQTSIFPNSRHLILPRTRDDPVHTPEDLPFVPIMLRVRLLPHKASSTSPLTQTVPQSHMCRPPALRNPYLSRTEREGPRCKLCQQCHERSLSDHWRSVRGTIHSKAGRTQLTNFPATNQAVPTPSVPHLTLIL